MRSFLLAAVRQGHARREHLGGVYLYFCPGPTGDRQLQANFRNSLRTVGQHLEGLFLQYHATLGDTIATILGSIAHCRQRQRPNRSYPRVSRRPDDRFRPKK